MNRCTKTQTDRLTDRRAGRYTDSLGQADLWAGTHRDRHMERHAANKQTDKITHSLTNRQTCRQIDRHVCGINL